MAGTASHPLIPELSVTDCEASLAFRCGICGFSAVFDRPLGEERYRVGAGGVTLRQVLVQDPRD